MSDPVLEEIQAHRETRDRLERAEAENERLTRDVRDITTTYFSAEAELAEARDALAGIVGAEENWDWLEHQPYASRPRMMDDRMEACGAFQDAIAHARAVLAKGAP